MSALQPDKGLCPESVMRNLSHRFSSFNSQSATVIAESFFNEVEWHLIRGAKHSLGEAVKYAHEGISVNRRLTAVQIQRDVSENQPQASIMMSRLRTITFLSHYLWKNPNILVSKLIARGCVVVIWTTSRDQGRSQVVPHAAC